MNESPEDYERETMIDFTLFVLALTLAVCWVYSWSKKPKDLPPGPAISVPVFGDVLAIGEKNE